jgi:vitamin B12 transporter
MGKTRISLFLAVGASFLAAAPEPGLPGEVPRPVAEASATVTVTAEAMPVELVKTPNPVRVLDKAAIEASGARTLGDLLESLFPGQLLANGGVGTSASLYLGGSRNQDVAVTLDGIRLMDASGLGGVNANALGLAGIDRVEVQVGPCSSTYGSDAMGGVVALSSSASAPKGFSGELKAGLGTQGIRQGSLAPAYGWNGGWVRAQVQGSQEDQATATNKPFRATGVFLGAGQSLGEDTLLTFSYRNAFTGIPTPYTNPASTPRVYDADREEKVRSEQIIASLHSMLTPQWLADLTLGQALQTRQEPNYGAPGYTPYDSRRNQLVGHLGWLPGKGFGLNWNVDAYEEFAATPGYPAGTDRGEGHHLGLSMEGNWEPLAWLRLVGSAREQWDSQKFVFPTASGVPDTSTQKTTWKLGANATLGAGFRAYASGGSGFSLPLLSAVMYNANNFGATLQTEASTFLRLGAGWERGPWSTRVEASRTHFSHLVYFDLNSYVYANGSQMRIQGVEGALTYKVAQWGAEAFWRNQEARELDVAPPLQLSNAAVIRRPFNIVGAKGWLVEGAFRLEGAWTWAGSRYENFGGFPSRLAASRTHFNDLSLAATWTASRTLSVSLRGEHLLQPRLTVADWRNRVGDGQNDASQIYGFPAQPPTLALELRYRF